MVNISDEDLKKQFVDLQSRVNAVPDGEDVPEELYNEVCRLELAVKLRALEHGIDQLINDWQSIIQEATKEPEDA